MNKIKYIQKGSFKFTYAFSINAIYDLITMISRLKIKIYIIWPKINFN